MRKNTNLFSLARICAAILFLGTTPVLADPIGSFSQTLDQRRDGVSCVNREYKSRTVTNRQEVGKERQRKRETFRTKVKDSNYRVKWSTVEFYGPIDDPRGDRCSQLRKIKDRDGSGIIGIEYQASARSDGPGTRGVTECMLLWQECEI